MLSGAAPDIKARVPLLSKPGWTAPDNGGCFSGAALGMPCWRWSKPKQTLGKTANIQGRGAEGEDEGVERAWLRKESGDPVRRRLACEEHGASLKDILRRSFSSCMLP